MFRSPGSDPALLFETRTQVKATTDHKEHLPTDTAADWTCQHTPADQINQIISQFPLQLVQFTALHGGEKGEGMSDSPLEINTLKKIVCLAERPACLSAASCTIKTALGYKSLLYFILAKYSLCLYLPHPWGKTIMELWKYRKYLAENIRKKMTLSTNTIY